MFVVLQDSRNRIDNAPQKWVQGNENGTHTIYWPKINVSALQRDVNSEPVTEGAEKWFIVNDIVKRWNIPTLDEANKEVHKMMESLTETETEDDTKFGARNTRNSQKVSSKSAPFHIPTFNATGLLPNQPLSALQNKRISLPVPSPTNDSNSATSLNMFQHGHEVHSHTSWTQSVPMKKYESILTDDDEIEQ